jgi:hypothetical protein
MVGRTGRGATHPVRLVLVTLVGLLATGCDGQNPSRPSPPAPPAVTGLAITGADAVLTGLSASYSVTATLGDGSTRTVTPAWSSSDPGVGSVDSAGRFEGRAHGSTNLTAVFDGRSASKTVQVVTNYAGTWQGQYLVRACTDTGDLTDHDGGFCSGGPRRVGTTHSIRLVLVQTGSELSEITGTLGVYEGEGKIAGVVTPDGRLSLGGIVSLWDWYGEVILATVQIRAWDTKLGGSGVMTGSWSEDYLSLHFRIGTANTHNELVTMAQVSTSGVPAKRLPTFGWPDPTVHRGNS